MKAEARILHIVATDNGGPRKRSLLDVAATRYGEGPHLIDYMIAGKKLVRYGATKNATWGLPKARRAA